MSNSKINDFTEVLNESIKRVNNNYFILPVSAGLPISRERVFCYELYHQIRCKIMVDGIDMTIHAEVDKSGGAIIKTKRKPDFIWHVSGTNRNHVVMEVKSAVKLRKDQLKKDIETLNEFITKWQYKAGILLVFSDKNTEAIKNDIERKVSWDLINSKIGVYLGLQTGIQSIKRQNQLGG